MTIREILAETQHRPWKLPSENWRYYQEWNNVIFLHWKVEKELLSPLVPESLEIDLTDGNAWVSLVVFTMDKIRYRDLPAFKPISVFEEVNIRTYVKLNNEPGVYFLSMEGSKKTSTVIAKALSELPYRYSSIKREPNRFTSNNKMVGDSLEIEYETGEKIIHKTTLEKWLTERYALIQDGKRGINKFEVHHIEWPILSIKIKKLKIQYPRFQFLMNKTPNLVHYSNGVRVLAWPKTTHQSIIKAN